MGVTISSGDVLKVFNYFNMERKNKGGCIYVGMGNDGIYRTCKLDFHASGRNLAIGTANKIAQDLGFQNTKDLKNFIDNNL